MEITHLKNLQKWTERNTSEKVPPLPIGPHSPHFLGNENTNKTGPKNYFFNHMAFKRVSG